MDCETWGRWSCALSGFFVKKEVRTISWTAYTAYPFFLRYSAGLSHPSDLLMRPSR